MNSLLDEITQISIYLKEKAERVNEVALFQPLARPLKLSETERVPLNKKWSHISNLTFQQKIKLNLHRFIFKYFPSFIPGERLTVEAKFKTILALLLSQDSFRDFFLSDRERRKNFLFAIEEVAKSLGFYDFAPMRYVEIDSPLQISHDLTLLGHKSLIEDPNEFNLQIGAIPESEKNEILFTLLNQIERPATTSVIEVTYQDAIQSIKLQTLYAKYKILYEDPSSKKISFSFSENHATSSILTQNNTLPDAKGVINQRKVIDEDTDACIGSYCGQLTTPYHVLEQILLILGEKEGELFALEAVDSHRAIEKNIIFTSLFSWNELGAINQQRSSIQYWNQKILQTTNHFYKLNLIYFNIPFNTLNKYPIPAEIKAKMQDINDEALILLTAAYWKNLELQNDEIIAVAGRIKALQGLASTAFVKKEQAMLEEIDLFRKLKPALTNPLKDGPLDIAFRTLLMDLTPNKKRLCGVDKLLYLDYVAKSLGFLHNKNCHDATNRTKGAITADKAAYVYQIIYKNPFLPDLADEQQTKFFKILYSIYLIWEEPEVNHSLNAGFNVEQLQQNFIQKNPEITRYLDH